MSPETALQVTRVSASYGVTRVLHDVSLTVPTGSIVSLLGPNGAGKSTAMRVISGLLGIHRGTVTSGSVSLFGRDVTAASAPQRVSAGLAQALEGRQVFVDLTVDENLRTGAYRRRGSRQEAEQVREQVLDRFPRLRERLALKAGFLSGGEQQMLAMGRAMMSSPSLVLLDEPSLGLAPRVVEDIRDAIVDINRQGTSVLLVEQNAVMALSVADYGYVLEGGRVVKEGTADSLRADDQIRELYLGVGARPVPADAPAGAIRGREA